MQWSFRPNAPIHTQLTDAFRTAIASGALEPGERLRSVRELAAEAGVNPNTMQRALAELEREGLVYSQRTAGRFVTEDAAAAAKARRAMAEEKTAEFLRAMSQLGLGRREILAMIETYREE